MRKPLTFDESLVEKWGRWVIQNGLPELPASLERDWQVPIARWIDDHQAVVAFVRTFEVSPNEWFPICTKWRFVNRSDQCWYISGHGAGSSWFIEPFSRVPDLESGELGLNGAWLRGISYFHPRRRPMIRATAGIASSSTRYVEVEANGTTRRHEIESPFGAFVAVNPFGDGEWKVRALDKDQKVLSEASLDVHRGVSP